MELHHYPYLTYWVCGFTSGILIMLYSFNLINMSDIGFIKGVKYLEGPHYFIFLQLLSFNLSTLEVKSNATCPFSFLWTLGTQILLA